MAKPGTSSQSDGPRRKKMKRKKNKSGDVSQAALRYKTTQRMNEISRRREPPLPAACRRILRRTQDITKQRPLTRNAILLLIEKEIHCPNLITDKELRMIKTRGGIYKSALIYQFTEWMELLSLPSYKFLKDRKDANAMKWKKYIIEESFSRGKRALEEKARKEERKRRRAEIREKKRAEKLEAERTETSDETADEEHEEKEGETADEDAEKKEEDQAEVPAEEKPEEKSPILKQYEEEEIARRRAERNAWRFAPSPCKKNPFAIKRSALRGKVSPRMAELCIRTLPKALTCKKNPFGVKRSALKGKIRNQARYDVLARPTHPRDPIVKPPPRKKDTFGRPIYAKPPQGRKFPETSPIKPAKCPDKDKKDEDDEAKKKFKKRYIDPIVYEPTIDPCFDPERAKRQMRLRKAAKEELKRRKEAREKQKEKEKGPSNEQTDKNKEDKNKKKEKEQEKKNEEINEKD